MADERVSGPDDVFFEALAGRAPGQPGADAMRAVLLEEAATVQAASSEGASQPSPEQAALRERIKAKLIAERAFNGQLVSTGQEVQARSSSAPKPMPPRRKAEHSVMARFLGWLALLTAPQMAGLAASVVLGVLVVMNMSSIEHPKPEDVLRGSTSLSVSVADPARAGVELAERIKGLGGEAVLVQLNDKEWALSVSVPRSDSIKPVRALLIESGFSVDGLPPYDLIIRKQI